MTHVPAAALRVASRAAAIARSRKGMLDLARSPLDPVTAWPAREPCKRLHNESVTLVEERRLVTVLFADLVGFTGRADASDPELVREMQRTYFSAVSEQVERYGGVVENTSETPSRRSSACSRAQSCGCAATRVARRLDVPVLR